VPRARKEKAASTAMRKYHHGDLRAAMIAATLAIVEEEGLSALSVRAAAKRAGVSAGAPFRHFASRKALLTAVAEEATLELRGAIEEAIARAEGLGPRIQFRAIADAYMRWALSKPAQFEAISDRRLIDYDASPILRSSNDLLRAGMDRILGDMIVEAGGSASNPKIQRLRLEARALAYGLARMMIDGHFSDWSVTGEAPSVSIGQVLDDFIGRLAAESHRGG
jgi:AcrR family transcriptional regulator